MVKVHLRKVTRENFRECLNLQVTESQKKLVATTTQSLAEAYVDPHLFPLAVYDAAACGYEQPEVPVIGFTMYEIAAGVGFIMRLMIDAKYQWQGYGRATMIELLRRLKLHPNVEIIATSYQRENEIAAKLYRNLGFRQWNIAYAIAHPTEVYIKLEEL
ncbi:MAG: GNAT family N-acetyltransferase [Cyanobacteria bacterium J06639_14]